MKQQKSNPVRYSARFLAEYGHIQADATMCGRRLQFPTLFVIHRHERAALNKRTTDKMRPELATSLELYARCIERVVTRMQTQGNLKRATMKTIKRAVDLEYKIAEHVNATSNHTAAPSDDTER